MERLKKMMIELCRNGVCVAFSGGVDSTLLLKLAKECTDNVVAVTFNTSLHQACDAREAKKLADSIGCEHVVINVDEFSDDRIMKNPPERCYYCKKLLFSSLKSFAKTKKLPIVIDGTNADDLNEYRPGLKALKELEIISPLAACGITKAMVRQMLSDYGMQVYKKPSSPCLATRLPYNTQITKELIDKIDKAEIFLKQIGFDTVRVRVHGSIARIEVPKQDFLRIIQSADEITERLKLLGFDYVTLDIEEFRSGSMDIHINGGK